MMVMELGSPIVSPRRAQIGKMAMFASWDSETAIDGFLDGNDHRGLADGWHVRLEFMRRWGSVAAFGDLPGSTGESGPTQPVVAVTLARSAWLTWRQDGVRWRETHYSLETLRRHQVRLY